MLLTQAQTSMVKRDGKASTSTRRSEINELIFPVMPWYRHQKQNILVWLWFTGKNTSHRRRLVSYNWSRPGLPFTTMVLTLIPAWISNHTPSKVSDGITYPFPNFINHLSMMGLKLNHVSKRTSRRPETGGPISLLWLNLLKSMNTS